jgi:hypothetical protein
MLLMRSSNSKNLSGSDRVKTSPLAVQFWLWGQDALTGDLEAQGFRKTTNPEGVRVAHTRYASNLTGKGSSIYSKGGFGLHSSAAWLQTALGVVVYSRPKEAFFWLKSAAGLPELPAGPRELDFAAGLAQLQPFVWAYEAWILRRYIG